MARDDRPSRAPGRAHIAHAAAPRAAPRPAHVLEQALVSRFGPLEADLVEEWKRQALSGLGQRAETRAKGRLELHVGGSFALLAFVAGLPWGPLSALTSFLALLSSHLLQQLPAALWARRQGANVRIELSALGGDVSVERGGWAALVLPLLGTLVNSVVAAGLVLLSRVAPDRLESVALLAACTHAGWGLGQAVPLLPFAAGRALGRRLSIPGRLAFSAASLGLIALGAGLVWRVPVRDSLYPVIVFAAGGAAFAFRLAALGRREEREELPELLQRAEALLHADAPAEAFRFVRAALEREWLEPERARLYRILAWAAIGSGDPFWAHAALQELPSHSLDLHLVAAYLGCCNRDQEGIALLRASRSRGQRSPETTKLLIELLVKTGAKDEASELVRRDRELLTPAELSALRRAGIAT